MQVRRLRVAVTAIAMAVLVAAVPARADEALRTTTFIDARQLAQGSPAACVVDAVHQGLSIAQAVEACALRSLELPSAKGVNSFLATGGGLGRGTSSHGSVTCAPTGSDPRISSDGGRTTSAPHYFHKDDNHRNPHQAPPGKDWGGWEDDAGYRVLKEEADQQWREYYQALDDAATNDTFGEDPAADSVLHRKLKKELKEANDAIEARDRWRPSTVEVAPGARDVCSDLRVFVAECNRDGWASPDCREADRRMRGCADPTIATPLPDTTETCPPGEPDPESVEAVVTLVCSTAIKPAPGEDPCARTVVKATLVRGYVRSVTADPCGDPRAMPGQEQCAPTLTVATFGQASLENIVRTGIEKFGGPVFVVPLPSQGPIGPGPK